ncbi:protein of unknown function [Acidithiobacillus ferrivorans]|uniref:Uncharacterized protein n=1 Tax=Acidithiobacillus ferrivorans TaxID=160808 RepID=A0A060UNM1_9PROT|nr:hypothetical protein AFERRI_400028 [Acidithiobacillus ferrivorans]SMH64274.1 protein of unknown function [Acidithiobacillus ferrivorans]
MPDKLCRKSDQTPLKGYLTTISSDHTRIRKNCTDSTHPIVYMSNIVSRAGAALHAPHPGINIAGYAQ